jgi:hypothetical protein
LPFRCFKNLRLARIDNAKLYIIGAYGQRHIVDSRPRLARQLHAGFTCRASDGIGKDGLRSYLMWYGRRGPHGKVSSASQPAAKSGHLTGAFDRAGAHLGALREASHPPDVVLPVAKDQLLRTEPLPLNESGPAPSLWARNRISSIGWKPSSKIATKHWPN